MLDNPILRPTIGCVKADICTDPVAYTWKVAAIDAGIAAGIGTAVTFGPEVLANRPESCHSRTRGQSDRTIVRPPRDSGRESWNRNPRISGFFLTGTCRESNHQSWRFARSIDVRCEKSSRGVRTRRRRFLYLTEQGAVVMTRAGQVVTAWTRREFLPHVQAVLNAAGGI